MSATEFLRNVRTEEIRKASDDSDEAEDAARGEKIEKQDFIDRMDKRLERDYPGLHGRIRELLKGQKEMEVTPEFLVGIYAGATMLAHEITIAAEVHDANHMLGDQS